MQYSGRCDPCDGHHCDDGKECHIVDEEEDEDGFYGSETSGILVLGDDEYYGDQVVTTTSEPKRTPTCMCDVNCPEEYAPVCASNGKTVSRRMQ